MNWKEWFRGLISVTIAGGANAITVMAIDPVQFNLGQGLPQLGKVALVSAIVAVAMYLSRSPLPDTKIPPKPEVTHETDDDR